MNHSRLSILLAVFGLSIGIGLAFPQFNFTGSNSSYAAPLATTDGTISGRVLSSDIDFSSREASVQLFDSDKQFLRSFSLDETGDGTYRFEEIKAGTYYVGIFIPGYVGYYQNSDNLESATPISVDVGKSYTADISITPWAKITGTIRTTKTGEPVEGAKISE